MDLIIFEILLAQSLSPTLTLLRACDTNNAALPRLELQILIQGLDQNLVTERLFTSNENHSERLSDDAEYILKL